MNYNNEKFLYLEANMLEFQGSGVFLAYMGCILASLLCVVYGIINWNNPKEDEVKEIEEEIEWEKKDPELKTGGEK